MGDDRDSKQIKFMVAFVGVDDDGAEGIAALETSAGRWMPLVCSCQATLGAVRQIAQTLADVTGRELRVVKFSVREELAPVVPNSSKKG